MTNLVNLTPHALVLRDAQGGELTLPPSGTVARVDNAPGVKLGAIHGPDYADCFVPVYGPSQHGPVTGLPEDPLPGTLYVVSAVVLAAAGYDRGYLVAPGTGPNDGAVRNDKGQVVAVTRLVRG